MSKKKRRRKSRVARADKKNYDSRRMIIEPLEMRRLLAVISIPNSDGVSLPFDDFRSPVVVAQYDPKAAAEVKRSVFAQFDTGDHVNSLLKNTNAVIGMPDRPGVSVKVAAGGIFSLPEALPEANELRSTLRLDLVTSDRRVVRNTSRRSQIPHPDVNTIGNQFLESGTVAGVDPINTRLVPSVGTNDEDTVLDKKYASRISFFADQDVESRTHSGLNNEYRKVAQSGRHIFCQVDSIRIPTR